MARAGLLLVFKALLFRFCTATQCESDQVANLQNMFKASKIEKEVAGRSCRSNQLNAGICPDDSCTGCPGGETIPTTAIPGFPPGSLTCGDDACSLQDEGRDFYQFKNPSDYLTCAGRAACNIFKVQNASAICCAGLDSCQNSFFELQADPSCGGDVCCGKDSCRESSFSSVRNMACLGDFSCQSETSVTLTGDLMVGAGNTAGADSTFTFTNGGNHCVRIVGEASNTALAESTLVVEQPSNVSMLCDVGGFSCQEVHVLLSSGSCLHVTCGDQDCQGFDVLPLVAGDTSFQCFCTGSGCSWTNSYTYCEKTTDSDPCGSNSCPGTSPVCLQSETASNPFNCDLLANGPCATTSTTTTPGGGVEGDPHLRTLDGRHYTLMQQGSFLLWAFSGETEVLVQGTTKKVPVDFEIFTHYAGHASFTKGLLLVDKSQAVPGPALEVTTKDCRWRHVGPEGPVGSRHLKLTAFDGTQFGAFNLTESKHGPERLELLINNKGSIRKLAQLWISCRPGHQLSVKIKMSSQQDLRFVRGELAPGRLSLATGLGGNRESTVMATDAEYAVTSDWAALGGSPDAAAYFNRVDTKGSPHVLMTCTQEDKEEHAKTCRKYLGDSRDALYKEVMDDCIFDLCSGAGETAAELAAEIFYAN